MAIFPFILFWLFSLAHILQAVAPWIAGCLLIFFCVRFGVRLLFRESGLLVNGWEASKLSRLFRSRYFRLSETYWEILPLFVTLCLIPYVIFIVMGARHSDHPSSPQALSFQDIARKSQVNPLDWEISISGNAGRQEDRHILDHAPHLVETATTKRRLGGVACTKPLRTDG